MTQVNLVTKCFILDDRRQVLVLLRSVNARIRPCKWDLAGGRVEFNEDPNASVVREIREETNLVASDPEIMFVSTENEMNYILTLFYESRYTEGEIVLSDEHTEHKWISLDEFMKLDMPEKFHHAAQRLL